jgi:acetyl esterase/lipase
MWRALIVSCVSMVAAAGDVSVWRDIEFAQAGDLSLKLDLYKSSAQKGQKGPFIVYIHGGAWRSGTRDEMPLKSLVAEGYWAASVDYRLSPQARFPAQVHDIKSAIRFLRASQDKLQIDASRIVVAGSSAGGHLAALAGVTDGVADLEGTVGGHLDQSSKVQGIISFFGAADLTTILAQSTPHGLSVRVPALDLLLGGDPETAPELARLASPVFHVDRSDPPLLLLHGDQDLQMPINQSHELEGAYRAAGLRVKFEVVHGAGHGGKQFFDETRIRTVRGFLEAIR